MIYYQVFDRGPAELHNFTGTLYQLKKAIKDEEVLLVAPSQIKLSVLIPNGEKKDLNVLEGQAEGKGISFTALCSQYDIEIKQCNPIIVEYLGK